MCAYEPCLTMSGRGRNITLLQAYLCDPAGVVQPRSPCFTSCTPKCPTNQQADCRSLIGIGYHVFVEAFGATVRKSTAENRKTAGGTIS